jgi:hypothetical protein
MPYVTKYALVNGKAVWTNDPEAFKGTIFEGRVIIPAKQK